MANETSRISQLLVRSKEMLNVALADEDIRQAILRYNYTDNVLKGGQEVLEAGDQLSKACIRAAGEKNELGARGEDARKSTQSLFSEHIRLTRLALRENPEKLDKLIGNNRKIHRRLKDWIFQVEQFYTQAVTDEDLLQRLARYGITADKLAEGLEKTRQLHQARESHNRFKGKSQDMKMRRDKAIRDVRKWMAEFIQVCRLALKENPQLLEKLGIVVLSPGYRRKKPEPQPVATATGSLSAPA